jgi:hypothetical protein
VVWIGRVNERKAGLLNDDREAVEWGKEKAKALWESCLAVLANHGTVPPEIFSWAHALAIGKRYHPSEKQCCITY